MSVSARSLVWRERKSNFEKTAEEICSSGRPFFFRYTARRLEMSFFFFINGVDDRWRTILDHHMSHFLCGVPCLFFGVSFVFFLAPAWIFKKNWTRKIKNKRVTHDGARHRGIKLDMASRSACRVVVMTLVVTPGVEARPNSQSPSQEQLEPDCAFLQEIGPG